MLYFFAEGYKCRLTTFLPSLLMLSLFCECSALTQLLWHEQTNKYQTRTFETEIGATVENPAV